MDIRGLWCTMVCLLVQHTNSQTPPKEYRSEVDSICSGDEYAVGCGIADGSHVMNVTKVVFYMDEERRAFACEKNVGCSIIMGEGGDEVTEQPLINLHKAILHNCQGKPKCEGTVPFYNQVKFKFHEGAYDFNCGWTDGEEFLAHISINTRCNTAPTPTLPPYEYQEPTTTITTEPTTVATTEPTVPSTNTTANTTTVTTPTAAVNTTTKQAEATSKSTDPTPTNKGTKGGLRGSPTSTYSEMAIPFIVLGAVAGVAALVGLVVTIYIVCTKTGESNITRNISQTDQPLTEKDNGKLPLDDLEQPMYT